MEVTYDENFYDLAWKEKWQDMKRYGPSSRHTRRLILKILRMFEFKSVIDIGCGDGSLLRELNLTEKGYKIFGLDISPKAIEIVKSRIDGEFFVINIEKQTLDGMNFDLAICSEVLEHIKDDVSALENLQKICENLLLTVPSGKFDQGDTQMGHYRRYSKNELFQKLEIAGFEVISVWEWGFPFYSPIYRKLISRTSEKSRTGKYGIGRKFISTVLYYLFFLNVINKGDRLIVVAKNSRENSP